MKTISSELISALKEKQEKILADVLAVAPQKEYLKDFADPAMLPMVAASFLQSVNNALDSGNFSSFRSMIEWFFQMAKARGIANPLENNLDFLATVEEAAKKHLQPDLHGQLADFTQDLGELFKDIYTNLPEQGA